MSRWSTVAFAVLAVGACGHGGSMDDSGDVAALEQEVEAYHHDIYAAEAMDAARTRMRRHVAVVADRLGRMHGMTQMGGAGACAHEACRGMTDEMASHRQAMEGAADLGTMRGEADRHRGVMRAHLAAERQHGGGMGMMMMGR